ncbi:hypothetical protein [Streptomyces sp. NPDC007205]|uniref:hypothetical protein n=1 Tax=Streptomyces sp. NPDC007205 TaxID=3154316 RepID=UPI0033F75390
MKIFVCWYRSRATRPSGSGEGRCEDRIEVQQGDFDDPSAGLDEQANDADHLLVGESALDLGLGKQTVFSAIRLITASLRTASGGGAFGPVGLSP